MERILRKIFVDNWQRKIIAILSAVSIWFMVYSSITATRTFTHVPIRVVNLPNDKTIRGLMPNGILDRKLALTLTGTKDVVEKIEPGDFEVVIDASAKPDEWIVQIAKKNLVSLNPDLDLIHNITKVSQSEFVVRLSRLLTDKVPVYIVHPKGEPPEGYQFVDVWPQKLSHVISGPEEDVRALQVKGIELTFDLNDITLDELDSLASEQSTKGEEISFIVPESWKRVQIPFLHDMKQDINGAEAKNLRIDFLRRDLLPLDRFVPIRIFYPLPFISQINPESRPLVAGGPVIKKDAIFLVAQELLVEDVSRLFLEIVRDNVEIVIIASNKDPHKPLEITINFINAQGLEDSYVRLLSSTTKDFSINFNPAQREQQLRARFRDYMQRFRLYTQEEKPFELKIYLESDRIICKSAE